eukprot:scaffold5487_cov153-Skeletonema_marinoi.AAC.12
MIEESSDYRQQRPRAASSNAAQSLPSSCPLPLESRDTQSATTHQAHHIKSSHQHGDVQIFLDSN